MIEVKHLVKRFGSLAAVDDLTFTVSPGRVTGFLGPNGAGKTTTLRCALGLIRPTSGDVRFDGRHYRDFKRPMAHIGAALEASSFHPGRTALGHLRMLAPLAGVGDARCRTVLEAVGLSDVATKRVGQFSLGMRGRLSLAATLLADPPVLLLDEPTNGLDPAGIAWIRTILRQLAAEGRTVLVSSHVLSEVQQTVDDVVIIAHGRLVHASPLAGLQELTTPRTLVEAPDLEAFGRLAAGQGWRLEASRPTGQTGPAAVQVAGPSAAEIGARAFAAGIELHQLASQAEGLEATFLALTESQEVPR